MFFCFVFVFGDTLNINQYHVFMSRNLSVIFDRPIVCKTVQCIDQLDKCSWRVFDFDT